MNDARDDFEGQDSGPVMPVGYSGYEEERDGPPPTQSLTPAQHVARGRELILEVERARSRGYDDSDDIASWQADSMLALAHFSGAVAAEQIDLIEMEKHPVREVSVTGPEAAVGATVHERAAQLAENHLPDYLGAFLAGTLRQHHTLPALVDHQDRLAEDLIRMLSPLEETRTMSGSVQEVANKMVIKAMAIWCRGGPNDLPAYVVEQDRLVPVRTVELSDACGHDGPRGVVISG